MPFQLPDTVKPVSPSTAKMYKSYLNKLSTKGLSSTHDILQNASSTVIAIENLTEHIEDTEKRKTEARRFYSAVFFALYGSSILQDPHNALRKGFAKNNPSINLKDGLPWKPEYQG